MIINAFDNKSEAIINPKCNPNNPTYAACIVTFSNQIEEFVLQNYDCRPVSSFRFVTGTTPIYEINYKGDKFAFFKTYVGAPACVGTVEDSLAKN